MNWPNTLTIGYFGERMDLRIKQGSTFGPMRLQLRNPYQTPVDLTACTIRGQIRKSGLNDEVTVELDCQITDATDGKFEFGLSDEQTQLIDAGEFPTDPASQYVWDMELEDSLGRVTPLYYGTVCIFREVTR